MTIALLFAAALALPAAPDAATLGERLDAWIAPVAARGDVAGVVLVARGADVLTCRAYGMASLEHAVPNACGTKFMIGSIAKQLTAAAVLALEEDGKLSIDDPVSKFVPGFPSGDAITLRLLMAHRGGLARDLPDPWRTMPVPHSTAEIADILRSQPLVFPPGTKQAYSNNGYRLLARVIEVASGESYGAYLKRRVLDRAGMSGTGDRDDQDMVPGLATGYTPWLGRGLGPPPAHSLANGRGPGSVYSTVGDLLRWNRALAGDGVLGAAARAKMLDPEQPLGTGVRELKGRRVVGHNGVYYGYTGFLQWYPDSDVSVVYLGNVETGVAISPLEDAVSAIVWSERPEPPPARPESLPPREPEPYAGDYAAGTFVLSVRVVRGELMLGAGDGFYPLEGTGGDAFFYRLKNARVTFRRGTSGAIAAFTWAEAGATYDFARVP